MKKSYIDTIVKHYEKCLEKHGDTHLGVDWPKQQDVDKRYKVMLDVVKFAEENATEVSLLDFGCGAGHLLDFINDHKIVQLNYTGLDISEMFISLCRRKYPQYTFFCADVLDEGITLPHFDYVVLNGVFTEKREMKFEEMWEYFCQMVIRIFSITRKGLAFNVMSNQVDWEREDRSSADEA